MAKCELEEEGPRIHDSPGKAKSDVRIHFVFYKDANTGKLDMGSVVFKICKKTYTNNGKYSNRRNPLLSLSCFLSLCGMLRASISLLTCRLGDTLSLVIKICRINYETPL